MKYAIALVIIAVVAGGVIFLPKKNENVLPETQPIVEKCFSRNVEATVDAPYSVHETIMLRLSGDTVVGKKSGNQSGPDMTNGYEGMLKGVRTGDLLSLRFDYTIEGSAQSEQEEYELTASSLIKHRYPLVDEGGLLVPERGSSFVEQVYSAASCEK